MSETVIPYDESGMDDPTRAVVFEAWLAGTLGPRSPFYRTDPPPSYEKAWEAREAARADSGSVDVRGLLTRKDIAAQLGLAKSSVGQRLRNAKIKPKLVVNKITYYHPDDLRPISDSEQVAA